MTATAAKRVPRRSAPGRRDGSAGLAVTVSVSVIEKTFGVTATVARERHGFLTPRECQVAALMAVGMPNPQIAEALGISSKTLDIHRAHLMRKLAARTSAAVANTVHLVTLAECISGAIR